jgi:hypothetical protein
MDLDPVMSLELLTGYFARRVLQRIFDTNTYDFRINNLPTDVLQVATDFKPLVGPNDINHHGAWFRFHGICSIISIIHANNLDQNLRKNSVIMVHASCEPFLLIFLRLCTLFLFLFLVEIYSFSLLMYLIFIFLILYILYLWLSLIIYLPIKKNYAAQKYYRLHSACTLLRILDCYNLG